MKKLKYTAILRSFGIFKIPLLGFLWPQVVTVSDEKAEVMIPLGFRSKNHLGSMYFGSLAIGADTAIAVLTVKYINESGKKINFIFKDFKADFLRRAEGGNVHFVCDDGVNIKDTINKTIETGERQNLTVPCYAYVPKVGPDKVAEFALTLSVKPKS